LDGGNEVQSVAETLREALADSRLSLNEIERRCGVSHVVVSRFLRRERTITLPVASQLCDLLGLQLSRPEDPRDDRAR
jgi:transcriptional regulator with XRE-family HTH domain